MNQVHCGLRLNGSDFECDHLTNELAEGLQLRRNVYNINSCVSYLLSMYTVRHLIRYGHLVQLIEHFLLSPIYCNYIRAILVAKSLSTNISLPRYTN